MESAESDVGCFEVNTIFIGGGSGTVGEEYMSCTEKK